MFGPLAGARAQYDETVIDEADNLSQMLADIRTADSAMAAYQADLLKLLRSEAYNGAFAHLTRALGREPTMRVNDATALYDTIARWHGGVFPATALSVVRTLAAATGTADVTAAANATKEGAVVFYAMMLACLVHESNVQHDITAAVAALHDMLNHRVKTMKESADYIVKRVTDATTAASASGSWNVHMGPADTPEAKAIFYCVHGARSPTVVFVEGSTNAVTIGEHAYATMIGREAYSPLQARVDKFKEAVKAATEVFNGTQTALLDPQQALLAGHKPVLVNPVTEEPFADAADLIARFHEHGRLGIMYKIDRKKGTTKLKKKTRTPVTGATPTEQAAIGAATKDLAALDGNVTTLANAFADALKKLKAAKIGGF